MEQSVPVHDPHCCQATYVGSTARSKICLGCVMPGYSLLMSCGCCLLSWTHLRTANAVLCARTVLEDLDTYVLFRR